MHLFLREPRASSKRSDFVGREQPHVSSFRGLDQLNRFFGEQFLARNRIDFDGDLDRMSLRDRVTRQVRYSDLNFRN
jgi:hypothetical protein